MSPKTDTQRALHLLSIYYARLCAPEQQHLRTSIQEVTRMLGSHLFQALLDIHECYEVMLNCANSHVTEIPWVNIPQCAPDPQESKDPPNRDEVSSDMEPRCVRVVERMIEQRENSCTLLSPYHSTLPKTLDSTYGNPSVP